MIVYIYIFFFVIFIFVVMFFIQFCIIIVRNGMFYENTNHRIWLPFFYYVIDTVYIYSWKIIDVILTHLVMLSVKRRFFLSHMVFNFTIEWNPHETHTQSNWYKIDIDLDKHDVKHELAMCMRSASLLIIDMAHITLNMMFSVWLYLILLTLYLAQN